MQAYLSFDKIFKEAKFQVVGRGAAWGLEGKVASIAT